MSVSTFAQRLHAWRSRLGLSQSRAAAELDVHPSTLSAWQREDRQPVNEDAVLFLMEVVERQRRRADSLSGTTVALSSHVARAGAAEKAARAAR